MKRRGDLFLLLAPAALLAAAAAGLRLGPQRLSLEELLSPAGADLLEMRALRVLLAAAVGASLAVAGVIFQAILRNPLADPYVLGSSSGAGLGAALAIVGAPVVGLSLSLGPWAFGAWGIALAAFAGAALAVLVVYRLALVSGQMPRLTLLLAGVVVGYVLGAMLLFIVSTVGSSRLHSVMWWLLGSLQAKEPGLVTAAWFLAALGVAAAWLLARDLDLLALGEERAAHLGLSPEGAKRLFFGIGSLLTAGAVSSSGMIGFVGLVVPHLVRLLIGPGHRRLVPCAAFAGATFLVLVELVSRSALPGREIPIGVVTAFVGGPFFLWLLRRKRRSLWC